MTNSTLFRLGNYTSTKYTFSALRNFAISRLYSNQHLQEDDRPKVEGVTVENMNEKLFETVVPYYKYPYEQQLELKRERLRKTLKDVATTLIYDEKLHPAVRKHIQSLNGMLCPIETVKTSPRIDSYRNKDEISIGIGPDGKDKTLGHLLGKMSDNKQVCIPSDALPNTKASHKLVAKHYQNFIRNHRLNAMHQDQLHLPDRYWRQVTVKSNEDGHVMMVVLFHPQKLTETEIVQCQRELRDYFADGPGRECNIKSLYFQTCRHTRCYSDRSPFQLVYGEPYLYETLLGKHRFRISPESFFPVNFKAAEVLYSSVREEAGLRPNTTLLDVCCGVGVFGIVMADLVEQVIGIESVPLALEDARVNAQLNGIENVDWVFGTAQSRVKNICSRLKEENKDVVAIINPARPGLRKELKSSSIVSPLLSPADCDTQPLLLAANKVMHALRAADNIRRLIYVSCKPEGASMHNFYELSCGERRREGIAGPPFIPVKAIPVDMFPHTESVELIIVYDRLQ